jgi:hypothetical protein
MAKALPIDRFRKGEVVKNLDPLPGVPQGTKGRIYLVDGFSWIRYRVLFDNGADVGSLDGSVLARPKQYEEALARRVPKAEEAHAEAASEAAAAGASGDRSEAAAPTDDDQADKPSAGGKKIPAHLLERSKQARERAAS